MLGLYIPMKKLLLFSILALLPGIAIGTPNDPASLASILLPPTNLDLYTKPIKSLTSSEYWRIHMHGLRKAALHQGVWAARKTDRTEGRRVVPIKHFFLRSSERKDYFLENISLNFEFNKVKKKAVLSNPEKTASVFEIEFGGEFVKGPPGEMAKIDRGYVIRLSAFASLDSGIFYRSHQKYLLLQSFEPRLLNTGKNYKVDAKFLKNKVSLYINDSLASTFTVSDSEKSLNHGLLSMITGWNPLRLKKLEISGIIKDGNKETPVIESGLAALPEKEPKKIAALAGKDQMKALDNALKRPQQELETDNP